MCFFCSVEMKHSSHRFLSSPMARMVWRCINLVCISLTTAKLSSFSLGFAHMENMEWCIISNFFFWVLDVLEAMVQLEYALEKLSNLNHEESQLWKVKWATIGKVMARYTNFFEWAPWVIENFSLQSELLVSRQVLHWHGNEKLRFQFNRLLQLGIADLEDVVDNESQRLLEFEDAKGWLYIPLNSKFWIYLGEITRYIIVAWIFAKILCLEWPGS